MAGLTVIDRDPACTPWLRSSKGIRVIHDPDRAARMPDEPLLVIARASALAEVAELARQSNARHRLRGLLVHADVDPAWLPQMLDRAGLRTVQRLLVHRDEAPVRRVVGAWRLGSQDVLLAAATALPEALMVVTCALERVEVPWSSVPALAALSEAERGRLEIADDGSYVQWPDADVHLDLEALRVAVEPEARRRARADRLRRGRSFGAAVAMLRARAGLRQSDVPGLTARQVRRIEAGEVVPRVASLDRLAEAHGMSADDYLEALAELVSGMRASGVQGAR